MQINTAARVEDVRALAVAIGSGVALGAGVGGAYLVGTMARGVAPTPLAAAVVSQDSAHAASARGPQTGPASPTARSIAGAGALENVETGALQARLNQAVRPSGGDGRCLTQAVYYEARGESPAGQAAVAQVVLNRVRHPAYPKTVCGVVFQRTAEGCQFSFACDGALGEGVDIPAWRRAQTVAARALAGAVMSDVRGALMFQAASLSAAGRGVLAGGAREVAQIGAHIFYRDAARGAAVAARRETVEVAERGDPAHLVFASFTTGAAVAPPAPVSPKVVVAIPITPVVVLTPPLQTPLAQRPPIQTSPAQTSNAQTLIDLARPAVSEPS